MSFDPRFNEQPKFGVYDVMYVLAFHLIQTKNELTSDLRTRVNDLELELAKLKSSKF